MQIIHHAKGVLPNQANACQSILFLCNECARYVNGIFETVTRAPGSFRVPVACDAVFALGQDFIPIWNNQFQVD
jgi:hypothetical protein